MVLSLICDEKEIISKFISENPIYSYNILAYVIIMVISGFLLIYYPNWRNLIVNRYENKQLALYFCELLRLILETLVFGLSALYLLLIAIS